MLKTKDLNKKTGSYELKRTKLMLTLSVTQIYLGETLINILVIFIIEYNCTVHQTLTLLLRTIVEIMNISVMRCNE